MSDSTLYDDDILLWSEQQAAAIRKLGTTRRYVPNELDIENVAEEIESVGRSELAAVQTHLRLILLHLAKLALEADSQAQYHWQGEILAFHADMVGRYAPSMRQRVDLDAQWRTARMGAVLSYKEQGTSVDLPEKNPFSLDELMADQIDSMTLAQRLGR
jgi:hypothetical protein